MIVLLPKQIIFYYIVTDVDCQFAMKFARKDLYIKIMNVLYLPRHLTILTMNMIIKKAMQNPPSCQKLKIYMLPVPFILVLPP